MKKFSFLFFLSFFFISHTPHIVVTLLSGRGSERRGCCWSVTGQFLNNLTDIKRERDCVCPRFFSLSFPLGLTKGRDKGRTYALLQWGWVNAATVHRVKHVVQQAVQQTTRKKVVSSLKTQKQLENEKKKLTLRRSQTSRSELEGTQCPPESAGIRCD